MLLSSPRPPLGGRAAASPARKSGRPRPASSRSLRRSGTRAAAAPCRCLNAWRSTGSSATALRVCTGCSWPHQTDLHHDSSPGKDYLTAKRLCLLPYQKKTVGPSQVEKTLPVLVLPENSGGIHVPPFSKALEDPELL